MRKIGEVLRLRAAGLNMTEIARSTEIGRTTVYEYLARAEAAGLGWPLPVELDEGAVEARLFPPSSAALTASRSVPDWRAVHRDMKRGRHVTLRLLWLEWREGAPDGWGYSQFCHHYQHWLGQQDVVMRLEYAAGERCFVDFAGVDPVSWTPEHLGPWGPHRRSTWREHGSRTLQSSELKPSAWSGAAAS